jgi:hypothetical protein
MAGLQGSIDDEDDTLNWRDGDVAVALDSRYRAQLPAAYRYQEPKFPFPEAAGSLQGANVEEGIRQRRGTD